MNLAEQKKINKRYPLLYLVDNGKRKATEEHIIYSNGALFYIIIAAILMVFLAILLNVGLKIQSINYNKEIYQLNEMISLEEERNDRLFLKISELKSPSRILTAVSESREMEIADEVKVIEVPKKNLENDGKVQEYIANSSIEIRENYNNFLGTIYYVQDIIMVVSESVLTFFIP